jgi:hypothetical protein
MHVLNNTIDILILFSLFFLVQIGGSSHALECLDLSYHHQKLVPSFLLEVFSHNCFSMYYKSKTIIFLYSILNSVIIGYFYFNFIKFYHYSLENYSLMQILTDEDFGCKFCTFVHTSCLFH